MQIFRKRPLPATTMAFIDLDSTVSHSITGRVAALSTLSGYPTGSHVVGRVQNQFDLSSYANLLTSLIRLRNLARLAGDILYTSLEAKVDRQVFVRTELLAYVNQQAAIYGFTTLTTDDKDLIAYMIASNEAVDNAWILDFTPLVTSNRISIFSNLYKDMGSPSITSLSYGKKSGEFSLVSKTNLAIYNPQADNISNIENLSGVKKLALSILRDPSNPDEQSRFAHEVDNLERTHRVYGTRVLDHVFMLLMDTDIWDQFITPRSKTDKPTNEERAKGLKLLASYLHSLLMFPHMMEIQCFFAVYEKLERDFVHFPTIPAHLMTDYQTIVKGHDYIDVAGDVAKLMSSSDFSNDPVIKTNCSVFFKEFVTPYGLDVVLDKIVTKMRAITGPVALPNLSALTDPKYSYLLYSHPAEDFNVIYDVFERLKVTDLVSMQIQQAVAAIMPGLDRYFSGAQGPGLARLNCRVPFDIVPNMLPIYNPTITVDNEINASGVKIDLNCLPHTRDIRSFIRGKLYTLETATIQANHFSDTPRVLINRVLATKLENQLKKGWNSMLPTEIYHGTTKWKSETIATDANTLKALFESITGMNMTLIRREIGNPYTAQLFATYFSSFMTLYMFDSKPAKGWDPVALKFGLVHGYGKPYGTTYVSLSAMQPIPKPDDLIEITPGVYALIHKEIPLPIDVIAPQETFDIPLPHYIFAANSVTLPVTEWVMAEPMFHFSLLFLGKIKDRTIDAIFDKRFGYMADSIVLYDDSAWDFSVVDRKAPYNISATAREWNREKIHLFLQYKTFGTYFSGIPAVAAPETLASTVALTEKVEAELKAVQGTSTRENPEKAPGTKLAQVAAEEKPGSKTSESPRSNKKKSKSYKPEWVKKNEEDEKPGSTVSDGTATDEKEVV